MIQIDGLRKTYGSLVAVDRLSCTIQAGEILSLLGPNGAGKSTTVHCLVGLEQPDEGRILLDGKDITHAGPKARRHMAYVPEVAHVYDSLTPMEYLTLKGRLYDLAEDRIAAACHRLLHGFGLYARRHDPMVHFSKGMVQKVVIASALITEPRMLVLDEPLSGLDVETTLVLKEIMRQFAQRGGAVLYCSHMLDVVETVAHRVAILERGKLVALGTLAELRQKSGGGGGDRRLEELFRELTSTSDPTAQARTILG
jgi:ABC-2 type transport system ATP-binding protein